MQQRLPGWFASCLHAVIALVLLSVALDLRARPTNNDSAPATYGSFNIIMSRNIFDPGPRVIKPAPIAPAPDTFALVGTMSYSKGKFAFFDGTKSDYKKVLAPGATIAGYTVKDITAKGVTLLANGKDLTLKVGSQILRPNQKTK